MKKAIIAMMFPVILFSCKPRSGPLATDVFSKTESNQAVGQKENKSMVKIEKANVKVEPCEGCIKISELLQNRKSYSGKTIKVTGQVTKFNPSIMGKNWIHIQDGTDYNGEFDLTITTDQQATVGQIVTYTGNIVLDKDFGYGYLYSVLMEEGKPVI